MVDQNGKIALPDLAEGISALVQTLGIIGCIGADAGRLAILGRTVVIGRDQTGGAGAAHLQGQLPAQLDSLADQGGQQGHLGHQTFDQWRIVMLLEHLLQHAIKTRHPSADVGGV